MSKKEEMPKELVDILKKMCKMVDADFDDIDFSKEDWFMDYEWAQEQEEEFINWLTEQLKNTKVAMVLYDKKFYNKKERHKAALMFNLNYGWKIKQQEKST